MCEYIIDGSPYTADPKEISIEEEENEVPLETMQIQVHVSIYMYSLMIQWYVI